MNKRSPIYKALEARSEGKSLPVDFTSRMMCEVRAIEQRRRRRNMWWSIAGYAIAAIVAISALVYCCGGMFGKVFRDIVESSTPDAPVLATILSVVPAATILLVLDYVIRRRLSVLKLKS